MNINNFSHKLRALYWAKDEYFSPSAPLKIYHGFLIDKINQANSSKLKKLVWEVIHVTTGIFAYPILGFFAGLDMAVTLLNCHLNGKRHNVDNSLIDVFVLNVHGAYAEGSSYFVTSNRTPTLKTLIECDIRFGPEMRPGQFNIEKQQLAEKIKIASERCKNVYTKVYFQLSGSWEHGMQINLLAPDSSLPYCSNPLLPTYEKITYRF